MARCGCAKNCNCLVIAASNGGVTVAGAGTTSTPYAVAVLLDPDGTNAASLGPAGLMVTPPPTGPSHDGTGAHSTVVQNSDNFATASGDYAVCMGYACSANGVESVSIGTNCHANFDSSVAVGQNISVGGAGSVGIGDGAQPQNIQSVAVGETSFVEPAMGTAVGASSFIRNHDQSVALGRAAQCGRLSGTTLTTGPAVAVGASSVAVPRWGVACGYLARVLLDSDGGVAIGANSTVPANAPYGVAVGYAATASGDRAVAIGGDSATASGSHAVAVGQGSQATAPSAVAVGRAAQASVDGAVAVGQGALAAHLGATAVGDGSKTTADNQVMLGHRGVGGVVAHVVQSAPASVNSAELPSGSLTFSLNESTNQLVVTVKYSTGTVKTGTLALV
jgi:autotransporter adhesin